MAQEQPNGYALIFEREPFVGVSRTWAELLQRSEEIARQLVAAGATAGTRCALTLMDHPDTLPVLLALWRLDATAVLIDSTWGDRRRGGVILHSGATIAVTLDDTSVIQSIVIKLIERSAQGIAHPLPDGTAMLGYTSGSTGDPKGVPFTHDKLALTMQAAAAAIVAYRGSAPHRIACSMRLSGSGVLTLHYTWAVFSGATVVVLPELTFSTARSYWSRIEAFDIDQTFLVPPLIELLNHVAVPRQNMTHTPICLTGSSPLSLRTQERFQKRFGLPLRNAYGLSETMSASFFGHCETDGMATNNIGHPWLLQTRIRNSEGAIVLGEGEGVLELSGPTVFDGYYGNQVATDLAFDGRWFGTGDVVRRDPAGNYQLIGRSKDVVMKGGFSIYLNEVEEAALAVPGIIEAAAVPVQMAQGGEDIGLLIRTDPLMETSTEYVLQLMRDDLGAGRAPYRVVKVADQLPRTGQEKLDRKQIISLWADLVQVRTVGNITPTTV
jgi:acyl-CoA synthetase (AMP-forming)/AMP-acid ligase II